jgi:hypothetical protein
MTVADRITLRLHLKYLGATPIDVVRACPKQVSIPTIRPQKPLATVLTGIAEPPRPETIRIYDHDGEFLANAHGHSMRPLAIQLELDKRVPALCIDLHTLQQQGFFVGQTPAQAGTALAKYLQEWACLHEGELIFRSRYCPFLVVTLHERRDLKLKGVAVNLVTCSPEPDLQVLAAFPLYQFPEAIALAHQHFITLETTAAGRYFAGLYPYIQSLEIHDTSSEVRAAIEERFRVTVRELGLIVPSHAEGDLLARARPS